MGSSGSGSFTDYSQHKPANANDATGGSSGKDKCRTAFSTSLEEVSRCDYFKNHGDVPPAGTAVKVVFNGHRLSVVTYSGEEIGYLPTRFNYIVNCIEDGISYEGAVTSSRLNPTPSVFVDIIPA